MYYKKEVNRKSYIITYIYIIIFDQVAVNLMSKIIAQLDTTNISMNHIHILFMIFQIKKAISRI